MASTDLPSDPVERAHRARDQGDFRSAFDQFRAARAALDTEDLSAMGDAAWWLGLADQNLAIGEELHQRYLAEGAADRAATNALEIGFLWMLRGDYVIGSGWINRARRLIDDLATTGMPHALLTYIDVEAALAEHDLESAVAGAKELQRLGSELAAPTIASLGLLSEGLVLIRRGRVRDGFALLDEAMLPVIADQVDPGWAGNIYCSIMAACYQLADPRRARQWIEATERWCARFSDAVMFLGICRVHRVQLLAVEGAWADAEREAKQVREDLADLSVEVVAECEYQLGELHRFRGNVDEAARSYARARAFGHEPLPGEALLTLATGDTDAAWAAASTALEAEPDPFVRARLLLANVEIGLAAGRIDDADHAAAELQQTCELFQTPGFRVWADHAHGAVLLARGDASAALPVLERAYQGYRQLPDPYDAARMQLLLAQAHRDVGAEDAAQRCTEAAAAAFRALGAPGAGKVRTGGLTDREIEVLIEIAQGASNREAAAAMFISESTVRRHLANIYAKLGVGSRTAAAAWAFDHGLVHRSRS